jgi:hypothetical protein
MNKNYIATGMIGLAAFAAYYINGMPESKAKTSSTNIESIAKESYSTPVRLTDIREESAPYENIQFISEVRPQRTNNNGLVYITQDGPSLNPANGAEELPAPDTYSLNPTVQGSTSVTINPPQTTYSNPNPTYTVPQNQVYREQQVVYYDRPLARAVGRSLRGVGIGLRAVFRRIFCGRRNIETILVPTNEPIIYSQR